MSGISDLPFRRAVKRFGASLVFSEMIASHIMLEELRKKPDLHKNYEDEFPIAVQLAGCDPAIMAEAARINEARGASVIDINFGCPVKKIVNNFAGSALMKDEALAANIMDAVVKAVSIPVTVKMRLGWDHDSINAPKLAKIAEGLGVRMVTVHGRTRNQLYNGNADWTAVAAVKQNVGVPVIVNGDIETVADAVEALARSGADGVMIGRGACGKPWLVRQVMDHLARGQAGDPPSLSGIAQILLTHYDEMIAYYGQHLGVGIARKHIGWYCGDMPGADHMRAQINALTDPEAVKDRLRQYFLDLTVKTPLAA